MGPKYVMAKQISFNVEIAESRPLVTSAMVLSSASVFVLLCIIFALVCTLKKVSKGRRLSSNHTDFACLKLLKWTFYKKSRKRGQYFHLKGLSST